MSTREGSLEAPVRHPIDWNNPAYYDIQSALAEMERVFDICHGCRRCVSLCNAFPVLFDLVDASPTLEVDGIPKEQYWRVVDQCYLCDVCYMTKCPYVPPHAWNVDFPHLMLRGKAIQFRKGSPNRIRDNALSSTDRNGKLASIPVVVKFVNAAAKSPTVRGAAERVMGIHREAWVPSYSSPTFRSRHESRLRDRPADSPGNAKVLLFATCYVNYNEPGIGADLLKVLKHQGIETVLARSEACCGMPKLELGDLESVARLKDINIPALAEFAEQGYTIVSPIPSCTLMFKQELPLLFPDDPRVQSVSRAMQDPFELLTNLKRKGQLKTDFKAPLGRVSYHIPCHSRVQNVGQRTREFLELVPGTTVTTVERCSGHAGTWGVKAEYHETAMKIGRPVFRQMKEAAPDYISSDCQLAGHHIAQGISRLDSPSGQPQSRVAHPLSLVRLAYGLPDGDELL